MLVSCRLRRGLADWRDARTPGHLTATSHRTPPPAGHQPHSLRHSLVASSSGRHPDYLDTASKKVEVAPRPTIEDDVRYRRVDDSELHAFQARLAFAQQLSRGEGGMRLAEAALQVAAEDDAIGKQAIGRCAGP